MANGAEESSLGSNRVRRTTRLQPAGAATQRPDARRGSDVRPTLPGLNQRRTSTTRLNGTSQLTDLRLAEPREAPLRQFYVPAHQAEPCMWAERQQQVPELVSHDPSEDDSRVDGMACRGVEHYIMTVRALP